MKNILITGSYGFLGTNIINSPKANKYKFYCIDKIKKKINKKNIKFLGTNLNDINNKSSYLKKIDIILYLASYSRNFDSINYQRKYYDNNLIKFIDFFDKIKKLNKDIIYISSMDVKKVSEYSLLTPYIISKLACERYLIELSKKSKSKVSIIRLSSLYQKKQLDKFRVISQLQKKIKNNKKISINNFKSSFVDMNFAVNNIFNIFKQKKKLNIYEIFNKISIKTYKT